MCRGHRPRACFILSIVGAQKVRFQVATVVMFKVEYKYRMLKFKGKPCWSVAMSRQKWGWWWESWRKEDFDGTAILSMGVVFILRLEQYWGSRMWLIWLLYVK